MSESVSDMRIEVLAGALGALAGDTDSLADLEYKYFYHALEGTLPSNGTGSLPFYQDIKVQDISCQQTYVRIAALPVIDKVAGTYQVGMATEWIHPTLDVTAYFRLSLDGGTTWKAYTKRNTDPTQYQTFFFQFPRDLPAGPITLVLEGKVSAGQMDVTFADMWLQRVL